MRKGVESLLRPYTPLKNLSSHWGIRHKVPKLETLSLRRDFKESRIQIRTDPDGSGSAASDQQAISFPSEPCYWSVMVISIKPQLKTNVQASFNSTTYMSRETEKEGGKKRRKVAGLESWKPTRFLSNRETLARFLHWNHTCSLWSSA